MPKSLSGTGNLNKVSIVKVIDDSIVEEYSFKFNFTELNRNISAEYNMLSPPGSPLPTAVYKSTPGSDIGFTIITDSTESFTTYGVAPDLAFFESLSLPDVPTFLESNARWIAPPRLILIVSYRSWDVVCTSLSIREVMFNRALAPTRAYIDIGFKTVYTDSASLVTQMDTLRKLYSTRIIEKDNEDPNVIQNRRRVGN